MPDIQIPAETIEQFAMFMQRRDRMEAALKERWNAPQGLTPNRTELDRRAAMQSTDLGLCVVCGKPPASKRSPLVRGLCCGCYRRHRIAGTLEATALPHKPNGRARKVGDRWPAGEGYVYIRPADRPNAITEHRYVMEQTLGRRLTRGETVHHINGVRDDNRPENLELWFAQPYGQRVHDLIRYVVEHHTPEVLAALKGGVSE